jgi:Fe-S-cluster containining protein
MHNHVKSRIKLTVLKVIETKQAGKHADDEDQAHVRAGVSCGTCKANKGCCSQSVSALMFEGLPIARQLIREGRDSQALRNQLHEVGDAMEKHTQGEWFDKATPCVFLTEEQKCSIYAVRPSACRHHVVFSPPERCSPPKGKPTLMFGSEKELTTAFNWNMAVAEQFFGFEPPSKTGVVIVGSLPKVVARVLDALSEEDFCKALREQDWPTIENPPNMA